jgi:hypothetical protein
MQQMEEQNILDQTVDGNPQIYYALNFFVHAVLIC